MSGFFEGYQFGEGIQDRETARQRDQYLFDRQKTLDRREDDDYFYTRDRARAQDTRDDTQREMSAGFRRALGTAFDDNGELVPERVIDLATTDVGKSLITRMLNQANPKAGLIDVEVVNEVDEDDSSANMLVGISQDGRASVIPDQTGEPLRVSNKQAAALFMQGMAQYEPELFQQVQAIRQSRAARTRRGLLFDSLDLTAYLGRTNFSAEEKAGLREAFVRGEDITPAAAPKVQGYTKEVDPRTGDPILRGRDAYGNALVTANRESDHAPKASKDHTLKPNERMELLGRAFDKTVTQFDLDLGKDQSGNTVEVRRRETGVRLHSQIMATPALDGVNLGTALNDDSFLAKVHAYGANQIAVEHFVNADSEGEEFPSFKTLAFGMTANQLGKDSSKESLIQFYEDWKEDSRAMAAVLGHPPSETEVAMMATVKSKVAERPAARGLSKDSEIRAIAIAALANLNTRGLGNKSRPLDVAIDMAIGDYKERASERRATKAAASKGTGLSPDQQRMLHQGYNLTP